MEQQLSLQVMFNFGHKGCGMKKHRFLKSRILSVMAMAAWIISTSFCSNAYYGSIFKEETLKIQEAGISSLGYGET